MHTAKYIYELLPPTRGGKPITTTGVQVTASRAKALDHRLQHRNNNLYNTQNRRNENKSRRTRKYTEKLNLTPSLHRKKQTPLSTRLICTGESVPPRESCTETTLRLCEITPVTNTKKTIAWLAPSTFSSRHQIIHHTCGQTKENGHFWWDEGKSLCKRNKSSFSL